MTTKGKAEAPEWFQKALAMPYEDRQVEVEGCSIHYLKWGDSTKPGLLFMPGGGGHAHWFSHVAPLFTDQFHVVSMDLAGTGDSGRRAEYSHELMVAEVVGVCEDSGLMSCEVPPIIVGHSMGGQFAVRVAMAEGKRLLGVIAVDALRQALLDKDPAVAAFADRGRLGRSENRIYPDWDSAVARFRLQPQPSIEITTDYVLDHIGRHSVHEERGGWTWKYDPNLSSISALGLELKDELKSLHCKSAAVFGEHSHIVDENSLRLMDEATDGCVPSFIIPEASHYPMIDNPLMFVSTIKATACQWVADWRGSH